MKFAANTRTWLIMEKKIKLEELHKRMISEIQDYAIILMDTDGTILTWNKVSKR